MTSGPGSRGSRLTEPHSDGPADPDPEIAAEPDEADRRLAAVLADLLDRRAPTGSVCPSEVARAVGTDDNWRDLMEPVRVIARRLVARGEAEITQRGTVVDPTTVTGPIRIRRPRTRG